MTPDKTVSMRADGGAEEAGVFLPSPNNDFNLTGADSVAGHKTDYVMAEVHPSPHKINQPPPEASEAAEFFPLRHQ